MRMRQSLPVVGWSPSIVDHTKPEFRPDSWVETRVCDTRDAITAKAVDAGRSVNGMINRRNQNERKSAKYQIS
jgi:hypothetical protein